LELARREEHQVEVFEAETTTRNSIASSSSYLDQTFRWQAGIMVEQNIGDHPG
jgi:hypothetical protein